MLKQLSFDAPESQPVSQQGLSTVKNGLEPLKARPARESKPETCEHPQGRWAQPDFPFFVSKLFEKRVTLGTQLPIKCGQVSVASRSSILAQRCCSLSAGEENKWFPEAERKACLSMGHTEKGWP